VPSKAACDRVLKLMHRGLHPRAFLEIIRKLRASRPGIGITRTSSSGFPGETDADFEETSRSARSGIRQRLSLQVFAAQRHARRRHADQLSGATHRSPPRAPARSRQQIGKRKYDAPLAGDANSGWKVRQKKSRAHDRSHALATSWCYSTAPNGIAAR